jgi:hypothetical protein
MRAWLKPYNNKSCKGKPNRNPLCEPYPIPSWDIALDRVLSHKVHNPERRKSKNHKRNKWVIYHIVWPVVVPPNPVINMTAIVHKPSADNAENEIVSTVQIPA